MSQLDLNGLSGNDRQHNHDYWSYWTCRACDAWSWSADKACWRCKAEKHYAAVGDPHSWDPASLCTVARVDEDDTKGKRSRSQPQRLRESSRRLTGWQARARRWRSTYTVLRAKIKALEARLELVSERWSEVRVSSPLTKVCFWERPSTGISAAREFRWWQSWCPCCKRPIDISSFVEASEEDAAPRTVAAAVGVPIVPAPSPERFAYVASLWGANSGFVVGALVLGRALRRSGTSHDLVLLHTDDVPESSCALLAQIWILRKVEFVDAVPEMFLSKGHRFDGVFTKLHVLGLVEYTKVLMLDIDLAILQCPDELFQLNAPAALHRGQTSLAHGSRIDGRHFFGGESFVPGDEAWDWCQGGGINAGVMLLAPEAELYARALREVRSPLHPEHIPGAGPEQDYLTRLFAPWWTHIGVAYNFQLHHVFFSLEASLKYEASEVAKDQAWVPERLSLNVDYVCIVHVSGELKTWSRDPFAGESDEDFADRLLRDNSPNSYRLWIDRQGTPEEYAVHGVQLDGCSYTSLATGLSVGSVVDRGLAQVRLAAGRAAAQWREDLEGLQGSFPAFPALPELMRRLSDPSWPVNARFSRGAHVEVYWKSTGAWYAGTVTAAQDDGTIAVDFDRPGPWGTCARGVYPDCVRPCEAPFSNGV